MTTAARQTSTGTEHGDAMAKTGGQKPDCKPYKVQDYLKMNHYSFYEAETRVAESQQVPAAACTIPEVFPHRPPLRGR
ncbi:unnamed protein product [Heligmosomoides polygyrus]|uniref:Uncharacterized protein n=1 Tax=Heligmosomoides polygyrus TaxID=6339 RepID=A0A3P8D8S2_HELPZ|nr:unnamed protein product [Heligmosomoides polygyrus]